MKVLISAYACSPFQGSEPGMGWNFVSSLAHMHELHIITENKFREDIDKYFEEYPEQKSYYHFYFVKRLRLKLLRKILPPSYYWTYAAWQRKALKLAMELDKKEHFDIVHQLNMLGYREPGYLWKMDKPFVWGPMGNFNITPWKLLPMMGWYGAVFYAFRNMLNWWQARHKTRVRKAALKADTIICAMEDDRKAVKRFYGKDAVVIPEVGLTELNNNDLQLSERKPDEKLKICWSGIHIPRKALPLLLESIPYCQNRDDIELHILGQGQCTKSWKKLASKLGINNIIWYGQTSRGEALGVMQQCHVFTMTSLSDATSTVLLEALSIGMPVIALNHLGFAGVINENCGIKINLESPLQIKKDIASAIDKLYENEARRKSLADGAIKRAQDFSWSEKAKMIDEIYQRAVKT